MSLRKVSMAAVVALAMATTPTIAQASAASHLSISAAQARSGAGMDEASELGGSWFLPLIAILAIVAGILAATSGGDDRPTSP